MINFEEIRTQVAIKHNVLLNEDDPILVTVTVSDMVLGRYLELVSDQYDKANKALIVNLEQQVEQSKETAGKIITDVANYASDQIKQTVTDIITDAGNDLRLQIANAQAMIHDMSSSRQETQTAKNTSIIAAVLAGSAAIIAVAALVIMLIK